MVFVGKLDAKTSAFVFQQIRASGVSASLATVRRGGTGFDIELCGPGNNVIRDFDGLLLVSVKRKKSATKVKKSGNLDKVNI